MRSIFGAKNRIAVRFKLANDGLTIIIIVNESNFTCPLLKKIRANFCDGLVDVLQESYQNATANGRCKGFGCLHCHAIQCRVCKETNSRQIVMKVAQVGRGIRDG